MQSNKEELWSKCLDFLRERIEPMAFKALFAQLSVEETTTNSIVLNGDVLLPMPTE